MEKIPFKELPVLKQMGEKLEKDSLAGFKISTNIPLSVMNKEYFIHFFLGKVPKNM